MFNAKDGNKGSLSDRAPQAKIIDDLSSSEIFHHSRNTARQEIKNDSHETPSDMFLDKSI